MIRNRQHSRILWVPDPPRQAVLIDPVKEQIGRDIKLLDELGLNLRLAKKTSGTPLRVASRYDTIGPSVAALPGTSDRHRDSYRIKVIGSLKKGDFCNDYVDCGKQQTA